MRRPASPLIAVALAAIAVALALGLRAPAGMAAITDCSLPGSLGHGDLVPATLRVTEPDGAVVTDDGTGYQVCISPNGTDYSIVIARADGMEDLGAADLGRLFTIAFTLPAGRTATSAELYADVASYAIGANGRDIELALRPVAVTSGTDGENPEPLQDSAARITGGIRAIPDGTPMHGIVGMWIGASANRYEVTMGGSCPNYTTGAPSGSAVPGSISVRLWAPHMTAGTLAPAVVNTGSLRAFVPAAVASACFNGASTAEIAAALEVARTAAGEGTSDLPGSQFTATAVEGGLLIDVPTVTFSSPTYRMTAPTLARARATARRSGRGKAMVTVVVPSASAGKRLVISERVGRKWLVRSRTTAKAGTQRIRVRLVGARGRAKVRVVLAGRRIAELRV